MSFKEKQFIFNHQEQKYEKSTYNRLIHCLPNKHNRSSYIIIIIR